MSVVLSSNPFLSWRSISFESSLTFIFSFKENFLFPSEKSILTKRCTSFESTSFSPFSLLKCCPCDSVFLTLMLKMLLFFTFFQVKIAIIGITAGGVGLDFSSAQHVVFLELPQSPSLMLQVQIMIYLFIFIFIFEQRTPRW